MAEGNKMDLTAKLPDEILTEVFDRLPSLCSKLRLESVNHRFQRCLVKLLDTKPIPLEIDVTEESTKLNGYDVPRDQLPFALQTLANKIKFSSIDLVYTRYSAAETQELNWILSALLSSDKNCLEKVTKFQIDSSPVSEILLAEAFRKCTKLSDVILDLHIKNAKNLGLALKEKTLIQLSVTLRRNNQQQLIELYQSIKPNTLKKIKLDLIYVALDVDQLVTELYSGAWAALEEIELQMCHGLHANQMDKLFSTLRHLPALRKCILLLREDQTLDQLVAALTSLFSNEIEITVFFGMITRNYLLNCELLTVIRGVKAVHPDLRVDIIVDDDDHDHLRLTLGKVTFEPELEWVWHQNCMDCGILYPAVISKLSEWASERVRGNEQDVHLANARLDRCRIDTVVVHVNTEGGDRKSWKAVQAEMNEAQNLATITFESESMAMGQFQITVDCGHCLTNGCFGCIVG